MEFHYTCERNAQIIISLMKANGIRKVVISPGSTNQTLVISLQNDSFFQLFSSVDERSAAYMACGMAAESGEPVVLSCTGATASRNYYPGLTEAYYRKLPVLTITSTQSPSKIGHNVAQVIDRSQQANDLVVKSEHIQFVDTQDDEFDVTIKVNRALHALTSNGGGPVHLNLETRYSPEFSIENIDNVRHISYFGYEDKLPDIPQGKIAVFVGNHRPMSNGLTQAIDSFCGKYDAVVFCDHTSNYKGKYRVFNGAVGAQKQYHSKVCEVDLLIHMGDVSGGYDVMRAFTSQNEWRVCEDGKTCDKFQHLSSVFAVSEEYFFSYYTSNAGEKKHSFLDECHKECDFVIKNMPSLPLSNMWIAQQLSSNLPQGCSLHLGILNSLRSWNFFDVPQSVTVFSNTGGFGIDGNISATIGASLVSPEKLFFLVLGDLAFFYDLNSLGNRHVGKNIRILLVNNGLGVEFRNPPHPCNKFGEDADVFLAAAGHNGNKSQLLVKHFAEDLGYRYLSANNKEEFVENAKIFLSGEMSDQPIIFEVFTNKEDEQEAFSLSHNIIADAPEQPQGYKLAIRKILPEKVIQTFKKLL